MAMAWNRGSGLGLSAAGVTALVAVALPAQTARAQWGGMMGGQGGDVSITRKGFDAYVRMLGLDVDQKEVGKDLMEGNRSANKALMEDMQAKMRQLGEKARETQDWEIFQKEMPKIGQDFQEKSAKLETQFFDDLKGLLTEEQIEKFPVVERHRRREIQMRFGLTIGASTDLVEITRVAKVDADKNAEIKQVMERYETDLDAILKTYEKQTKDSQKSMMGGGFNDPSKIEDAIKPLNDMAKQIRDINRQAAKRIGALITDETQQKAFDMEVKRREFPRVYKETHLQKSIAAAIKLEGLEDSQKDQLNSLKEQYERDVSGTNDRWAKALEEREDKAGGRVKMLMNMWEYSNDTESDVTKAKKARTELDEAAEKKIEGILKEDQRAQLPQKRPDKGSGAWGMGMFEDFGWDFTPEEDK